MVVEQAFDELYVGTTANNPVSQRSADGRRFIYDRDLRRVLTDHGDPLTDEEVELLIHECRPDEEGKIFFEQYKAMLLDSTL